MKPDYKLVAKAKYIHANADLASEIWHEVYKRYYPAKQLDTLVETLQSADAIEADIDNDVNYFLVFLGSSLIFKTKGYRVLGPAEAEAAGIPMQLTTLEKML